MNEVLEKITDDNKYIIYSNGEVYSINNCKFLNKRFDKDGYVRITYYGETVSLHRLIIKTFKGNPPKDMKDPTVDHIDGDKLNNNIDNLRWLERGKNSSSRKIKLKGELNHECILSEKEVIDICELIMKNYKLYDIGKMYNVSKSTISNIKRKKNWNHITKNYDFKIKKCKTKEECLIQREEIRKLLLEGKSIKEIKSLGYDASVIYNIRKELNKK